MKNQIKWFNIPVIICLLFITLLSSGCAQSQKSAVRYGGQYYPEDFLLKGDPKIWSDNNIKVEQTIFSSAKEGNEALISGAVDINVGSDSKSIALFNAIPDQALIIATVQRGDRYSTLVKTDSPYKSWADLKGKTIGVTLGTGAEQVMRRYFELNPEFKWDDYKWVNLKVEEMPAALANGSVDAFTAWEPTPAIAEAQGVGRVMLSYGKIALTPVLMHTTKKYAESHRAEIVAFLKAHIEKVKLIKSDPDKAAEYAVKAASESGVEVSPEAFKAIFKRVDFSLEFDDEALAALNDTAQFLKNNGQIENIPVIEYDRSFLEEAMK